MLVSWICRLRSPILNRWLWYIQQCFGFFRFDENGLLGLTLITKFGQENFMCRVVRKTCLVCVGSPIQLSLMSDTELHVYSLSFVHSINFFIRSKTCFCSSACISWTTGALDLSHTVQGRKFGGQQFVCQRITGRDLDKIISSSKTFISDHDLKTSAYSNFYRASSKMDRGCHFFY